ncbi:MAG: thrombospondin type 3 repeat-containing protein [Opitutaceae bacterium]|nr:thrombospondin type 3 repeat-containing protein [Opitutaceae bacterium]
MPLVCSSSKALRRFLRTPRLLAGLLAALTLAPALHAFPPAPFFTLHGMVRDEQGNALDVDGAYVSLLKNGVEVLQTPIRASRLPDQNYQFRLRMDMQRPGTASYTSLVSGAGAAFSLGVVLNNVTYLPIEMSTPRSVGQPGQRVRLNLTIGQDSDGDGIPDACSLMSRDGDFDGDGISNWTEYIAGTFATDATDYLALHVAGTRSGFIQLRFFGIYGKVYTLESSTDLQNWTTAAFFLSDPVPPTPDPEDYDPPVFTPPTPQVSHRATATAFADFYAPASSSGRTFYRLQVR